MYCCRKSGGNFRNAACSGPDWWCDKGSSSSTAGLKKFLGVNSAEELARVIVAVGLAQNFAALKALATTGIQKGHMALHAKNIAMMTDAQGEEVEILVQRLVEQGTIRIDVAEVELAKLRNKGL